MSTVVVIPKSQSDLSDQASICSLPLKGPGSGDTTRGWFN